MHKPIATKDVIVVGTGGTGLTAALAAAAQGAAVLLLESEEGIGGTTLFSGGQVWVPNNHLMADAGIADSKEETLTYMHETLPGRDDDRRWKAFVDRAPEMLRFLEEHSPLRFALSDCPDSFVEKKGGKAFGRSVEVLPVSLRQLGKWKAAILELPAEFRMPLPLMFTEVMKVMQRGRKAVVGAIPSILYRLLARKATMSKGLIAGLFRGCLNSGVELRLNTRVLELIQEGGRVTGVKAESEGATVVFRALRGVILATGSFDWNKALKQEFLPAPLDHSIAPPSNRGDAVVMTRKLGAKLARMDEAWYWPGYYTGTLYKGAQLGHLLRWRSLPHTIIVNRHGNRFANEAAHNFGIPLMYDMDAKTGTPLNQPAWLIHDSQFRADTEGFAIRLKPLSKIPGWLIKDETLSGLARKVGIDSEGLLKSVRRFNEHAKRGKDPDFHRNEFLYDRLHGDQRAPYPSLGTIEKPPYFAIQVFCSSVGTKGGPMTDENWQVISEEGSPIEGLYAVGNCSAAIIGPITIAPAGTLGPGLTAGYIAGRHAANGA